MGNLETAHPHYEGESRTSEISEELQGLNVLIQNSSIEQAIKEYNKKYDQKIIYEAGESSDYSDEESFVGIDMDDNTHKDALRRAILILKDRLDTLYQPWMINDYGLDTIIFCSSIGGNTKKGQYVKQTIDDTIEQSIYINVGPLIEALSQNPQDNVAIIEEVNAMKTTIEHEFQHYFSKHQFVGYTAGGDQLIRIQDYSDNYHFDYLDGLVNNEHIYYKGSVINYTDLVMINSSDTFDDYKNTSESLIDNQKDFQMIKGKIDERMDYSPTLYALTSSEEFMSELHSENIKKYLNVCEQYPATKKPELLTNGQIALIKLEMRTGCKIDPKNTATPFVRRISFEEWSQYPYNNEQLAQRHFMGLLKTDTRIYDVLTSFTFEGEKQKNAKSLLSCIEEAVEMDPSDSTALYEWKEKRGDYFLLISEEDWAKIRLVYECYSVSGPLSYSNMSRGSMGPSYRNSELDSDKTLTFDDPTAYREQMYVYLDRYRDTHTYGGRFTMMGNNLGIEFTNPPFEKIVPSNDTLSTIETSLKKSYSDDEVSLFLSYQLEKLRYDVIEGGKLFRKELSDQYLKILHISGGSPVWSPEPLQTIKEKICDGVIQDYFLSESENWGKNMEEFINERKEFITRHDSLLQEELDATDRSAIHTEAFLFYKKAQYEWTQMGYDSSMLGESIDVSNPQRQVSQTLSDFPGFPINTVGYLLSYPPSGELLIANPYGQQMLNILGKEVEDDGNVEQVIRTLSSYEASFIGYGYALAKYTIDLKSNYTKEMDQVYYDPSISIQEKQRLFEENYWEKRPTLGSDDFRSHYFADIIEKGELNMFFDVLKGSVGNLDIDVSSRSLMNQGVLGLSPNGKYIYTTAGFADYYAVGVGGFANNEKDYGTGTIAYRNTENKRSNTMNFDLTRGDGDLYIKIVPYGIDGRSEDYPKDDITFITDTETYSFKFDGFEGSWSDSSVDAKVIHLGKGLFKVSENDIKDLGSLRLRVHTNSERDQWQAHIISNYIVENTVDIEHFTLGDDIIAFDSGSAKLKEKYEERLLTTVVPVINKNISKNENIKVFVEGHTDTDGDDQNNIRLSIQRAGAVKKFLLDRISELSDRNVIIHGYGESNPLYPKESRNSELNRRVEITIE